MLELDELQLLFKCGFCSKIYVEPVSLPCGQIICRSHVTPEKCSFCFEIHPMPKSGFPPNKPAHKLLASQLDMWDIVISIFGDCKNKILELKAGLRDVEMIQKDPDNFISDHFL